MPSFGYGGLEWDTSWTDESADIYFFIVAHNEKMGSEDSTFQILPFGFSTMVNNSEIINKKKKTPLPFKDEPTQKQQKRHHPLQQKKTLFNYFIFKFLFIVYILTCSQTGCNV